MTDRNRFRVKDMDPVTAPSHTADDVIRSLKDLCKRSVKNGFTRAEAQSAARCNTSVLTSLLGALVKAEHLIRKGDRYLPQPSIFTTPHAEFHGEATFLIKRITCRKKGCEFSLIDGKCYVEICSICRNSHAHHPTEEAAWERIRRSGYHGDRKSHSLQQGVSVA